MSHTMNSRSGTVLLVVVGLSTLMLTMTLALTMKVQSDAQNAGQIRKFGQSYLIASVVHTRWPRLKATRNDGSRRLQFIFNLWDVAYDHPWDGNNDGTTQNFKSPPVLLGYFITEWRDVVYNRFVGLSNGGTKSTGYNTSLGSNGNIGSPINRIGLGYAYDYSLAFMCDENRNFPNGAHLLSPTDVTFPRPSVSAPSISLRTGNQLSTVLSP
jgi:hypothetical protein